MNKTSDSLNSSASPESGATDSLWQPSWWQWLISALSGTVETEKQIAWLKKHNEEMRKYNERLRKSNEEFAKNNEVLKQSGNDLRSENERLAELLSKIDASFSKHGINLPLASKPKQP
ncbi:hypothetical protein IQ265_09775 [Nodosilinea sp. LEGE 06152]|uniref:hypothetical protein n=1 Tax=Nodosilinea sp. LEGE 06152 TaxID=2777966 RepID=UPI0018800B18|nr:hypothetical protein [Nodosilinea sp. LEGE 06152]